MELNHSLYRQSGLNARYSLDSADEMQQVANESPIHVTLGKVRHVAAAELGAEAATLNKPYSLEPSNGAVQVFFGKGVVLDELNDGRPQGDELGLRHPLTKLSHEGAPAEGYVLVIRER